MIVERMQMFSNDTQKLDKYVESGMLWILNLKQSWFSLKTPTNDN